MINQIDSILERFCVLYFRLRLHIKLMSEADFQKLLEDCDMNQYIYALCFRYF